MSEINLGQIKGLTVNNNVVTVPSGHTLYAPGHVIQVVQGTTGTTVGNSSSTFVDTTLTATITPKFSTSKILVMVQQNGLYKETNLASGIMLNLKCNDVNVIQWVSYGAYTGTTSQNSISAGVNWLHSPSSTSSLVYKTQIANVYGGASVGAQNGPSYSTITLMEIAA